MPLNDPPIAQPEIDDSPPVTEGSPPAGTWRDAGSGRLRLHGLWLRSSGVVRANRTFSIILLAAALLRLIVMLGYPPAMFFNDSYNYMTDAVTKSPDMVRSDGYPLFLYALLPFHSLNVVTGLQALMGLAMGAGIYAVLRHRGLPWWGATIPALPVLFDVFEVQLEHMIAADVLFYTLVTLVLVLLCWWDRPPLWIAVLVGLATGYATTVRTVGEPLLVLVVVGMLLRRMGWRRVVATAVAGVVPILGYMVWFHSSTGKYALDESTGTFLYSRVQSFADCNRMDPSAKLRVLCDTRALKDRPSSQEYLWSNDTPLAELTGTNNVNRFTPQIESLTMKFAERAIEKQPLDYVKVVASDTLRTFRWTREGTNDTASDSAGNLEGSGSKFRFESTVEAVPDWVTGETAVAARDFGAATSGGSQPSIVEPWSLMLRAYQKVFYLRGPFVFLFVLFGAVGVWLGIRRRTRIPGTGWGGLSLMPWLVGVALIVLPPMTAGFSYRYVLAAIPAICLAAGLAFCGRGSLITWLRGLKRAKSEPASPETAA
ncbi:MAG TPA: hypothetical protein VHZ03_55620 [Trebonia sp.]|nr:hypothetical protein [Trebonia sp.]